MADGKIQKERNELNMELLSKKEPEFKDLENSPAVHIPKTVTVFGKEHKDVVGQSFDKEISLGMNWGPQPSQQEQSPCQLKGTQEGRMELRMAVGLLGFYGTAPQCYLIMNVSYSSRHGKKEPKGNSHITGGPASQFQKGESSP